MHMKKRNSLTILLLFLSPVIIYSFIQPKEYVLWFAETLPLFIGLAVLITTYKKFPLTNFSYFIIFIGATLMLIGAHYSYSYVPIGEWVKDIFGLDRNNYDKFGHFFQGFITVSLAKEVIIRKNIINSIKWSNFFTLSFAIALSGVWEILEWLMVVVLVHFGSKKPASDFLGTQNYIWDTQSDMFFALIGAVVAIYLFGKYHERQIQYLLK